MANEVSQIEVIPIGPVACAGTVWRMDGRPRVTVIVKASFGLVPEGLMTPAPPDEIVRAEVHHLKNPTRSVRLTADLAPYLQRADVVLTGHAHAPAGAPATSMRVRLAVLREGAAAGGGVASYTLLDKSIHVRGDEGPSGPLPFERIPLVFERTYGGIGWEENPLGTAYGGSEPQKAPNLFEPADPTKAACFGPISRGWPRRKRLLDAAVRKALDKPVAEVPSTIDWSYFQAAPPDQRIEYLQGNEWIVLEGMSPRAAVVTSRLPFARGAARVYGIGGDAAGRPLALVADTLRIDADDLRCSIVWRGSFAVPDASALGLIHIAAGVEIGGRAIDWPAPRVSAPPPAPPVAPPVTTAAAAPARVDHARTVALDESPVRDVRPAPRVDVIAPPKIATLPDSSPLIEDVSEFISTASGEDLDLTTPAPKHEGTITLDDEQIEARAKPSTPFARAAPGAIVAASLAASPPAAAPAVRGPLDVNEESTGMIDARARPPVLPFESSPAIAKGVAIAPIVAPAVAPSPAMARADAAPRTEPLGAWGGAPAAAPARPSAARARSPRSTTASGIQLFHEASLAIAVEPWGFTPSRDSVTVIAKATCDLVAGEPAAMRAEAEALSGDVHAGGDAQKSLVHATDLALFKARADVTLVGHAIAPAESAGEMEVIFRFGGAAPAGFERRVVVFGERRWVKGLAGLKPSPPASFHQMPLTYEHAFGGRAFDPNPIGVGHPGALRRGDARSPLPNLEDPDCLLRTPNQAPAPACFGPVPIAWKDRWAKLGWKRAPWPLFPEDFDWTRWQAAPPAQQIPYLRGDETFHISGMTAPEPEFEGALPCVRVRCFVEGAPGPRGVVPFDELPLLLDTAAIDLDQRKLTLVWRGALGVPDEAAPGIAAIHAVIERDLDGGPPAAELRAALLG